MLSRHTYVVTILILLYTPGITLSQIKKAKGLKKKIINPVEKQLKTILSFCYVNHENGSIPLNKFLENYNWNQENCGLINIPLSKTLK